MPSQFTSPSDSARSRAQSLSRAVQTTLEQGGVLIDAGLVTWPSAAVLIVGTRGGRAHAESRARIAGGMVAPGQHVVATSRDGALLAHPADDTTDDIPLTALVFAEATAGASRPQPLSAKDASTLIRSFCGIAVLEPVRSVMLTELGARETAKLVALEERRLLDLAAGLPSSYAGTDAQDAAFLRLAERRSIVEEPERVDEDERAAIAALQARADRVYGRLEAERAIGWALEELGELAQAIRRGEGEGRIREELGQLFAWTLCLANITGCDLGAAARLALQREVERQMGRYGRLRPYATGQARDAA